MSAFTVQAIISLLDESTLLGAAYDCLSDEAKAALEDRLMEIIRSHDESNL